MVVAIALLALQHWRGLDVRFRHLCTSLKRNTENKHNDAEMKTFLQSNEGSGKSKSSSSPSPSAPRGDEEAVEAGQTSLLRQLREQHQPEPWQLQLRCHQSTLTKNSSRLPMGGLVSCSFRPPSSVRRSISNPGGRKKKHTHTLRKSNEKACIRLFDEGVWLVPVCVSTLISEGSR